MHKLQPNARPVYLGEDFVRSITEENQALKIIAHEKADSWIPMGRISRLTVLGNISISANALHSLMQRGIPISFADSSGQYTGVAMGTHQQGYALDTELQDYFAYEQGKEQLENWFTAQENSLIKRIKKRFHIAKTTRQIAEIHLALNQHITLRYHYRSWPETLQKLQPILAAHQGLLLHEYGYDLALVQPNQKFRGLLHALMQLLNWELWQLAARGHFPANQQYKQLAFYYQQHQPHLEQLALNWLGKLWKRLNELHYEQQY